MDNPAPGADKQEVAIENEPKPLDFGFIKNPPGNLYNVGAHRLHARLFGEGETTVLLEPGLGGSSFEWLPLAEHLSQHVRVCIYDRGGYAWSDPGSNPRHLMRLSAETYLLFQAMDITGPVILVGHSYGGLLMRQLAAIIPNLVAGLVLVDASHEDQFDRMSDKSRVAMLPSSRYFVVSAPELPAGLRSDLKLKIEAFSRMRKTYSALHAEIANFAESCTHIQSTRRKFDFPVRIITRGQDPHAKADDGRMNNIWNELQLDMLGLSDKSTQVIADNSGHHIHIDQPELVRQSILGLL